MLKAQAHIYDMNPKSKWPQFLSCWGNTFGFGRYHHCGFAQKVTRLWPPSQTVARGGQSSNPASLSSPGILSAHVNIAFETPCAIPGCCDISERSPTLQRSWGVGGCVCSWHPPAQACGGNAAAAGSRKVVLNSFLCWRDFGSVSPTSQERSLTRRL